MIWKQIQDFPDYFISNTGEVKSTKHQGQFRRINSDGLLAQRTYKNGYKYVNLYKDRHMYSKKVHRLVAEAFIPNPNNCPQVNHIDEDKSNNSVQNLEWITSRGNLMHNDLHKRVHLKQKRRVGGFSKEGVLLIEFSSATEAALSMLEERKTSTFRSGVCNISAAAKTNGTKKSIWILLEVARTK